MFFQCLLAFLRMWWRDNRIMAAVVLQLDNIQKHDAVIYHVHSDLHRIVVRHELHKKIDMTVKPPVGLDASV